MIQIWSGHLINGNPYLRFLFVGVRCVPQSKVMNLKGLTVHVPNRFHKQASCSRMALSTQGSC